MENGRMVGLDHGVQFAISSDDRATAKQWRTLCVQQCPKRIKAERPLVGQICSPKFAVNSVNEYYSPNIPPE